MNIAVIGAGQLGSRHLQALARLTGKVSVQVLDLNEGSLKVAQQRMDQTDYDQQSISVDYIQHIDRLAPHIDVVIVATGANSRRQVIESVLAHSKVTYMVLEKVLFQRVEDYSAVKALFEQHNVAAWVNCGRRAFEIYRTIKLWLQQNEPVEISVSGGNWGLACNSIHFVDLFAFLTDQDSVSISAKSLLPKVIPSKRASFVEFVGSLECNNETGDTLRLTCFENSTAPVVVNITSPSVRCVIKESERKLYYAKLEDDWAWQELSYKVPLQSEQTQTVVTDLMETSSCLLTPFDISSQLHLSMITEFNRFLSQIDGKEVTRCPIT